MVRMRPWTGLMAALVLSACGRDSLIASATRGDLSRVQAFVDQGADVNGKGLLDTTALYFAARNGHLEVVGFLLEKGADPNSKATGGMTALMAAAQHGRLEVARILVEHGADVNAKEIVGGMTPLMIAAAAGDMGVVKLLIEQGADIGAQTGNGATASLFAQRANHPEVEKLLWDTLQTAYDKLKASEQDAAKAAGAQRERFCPGNLFVSRRLVRDPFECVTACPAGTQPRDSESPYKGAKICASTDDAVPLLR